MKVDIFIRTYKNDLAWLQYCLKSIAKYVTGYRDIIICIPENQLHLLGSWNLTKERIVTCPVYPDDYLGQQVSKLNADVYCEGADYILYVDSDCVFLKPFDCSNLLREENPVIYKTNYSQVGDAICWKGITEKALNKKGIEFEYMRRLPLLYRTETLADLREYMELIHGVPVETYIKSQPLRAFSEFNVLGAFADFFSPEKYVFINTDDGVEDPYLNQFWSWGGITPDIKKQIGDALK